MNAGNDSQRLRVLIAASHTGGHLFPAVEIARVLVSKQCQVEFLGCGRPLEEEVVGRAGFTRHVIQTAGLKQRGLKGIWEFGWRFPRAWRDCWRLISLYRPQVIIGVGGYVTFFPVVIGFLRGIPTWIHEAEERVGLANSVLGWIADKVSLAYPDTRIPRPKRGIYTGHPVRSELAALADAPLISGGPRHLLVLGGSQGARALDEALSGLIPTLKSCNLEVWHQCREGDCERLRQEYATAGVKAVVEPFIRKMAEAYAWTDLIISRSGAGSVREIGVIGKPAIFVPFPHSQGGHQVVNAMTLVHAGKALLVEEGGGFAERLERALVSLCEPEKYRQFAERKFRADSLDAAARIAEGCIGLALLH